MELLKDGRRVLSILTKIHKIVKESRSLIFQRKGWGEGWVGRKQHRGGVFKVFRKKKVTSLINVIKSNFIFEIFYNKLTPFFFFKTISHPPKNHGNLFSI